MNEFKTDYDGGLPLVLDDFRWMQNAVKDAFKGLMSPFGIADHYPIILSGCKRTVSGSTVSIAQGYVSIAGEICFVPAHSYSVPTGSQVEFWTEILAFESPTGLREFQNGDDNLVHLTRIAKVVKDTVRPTGSVLYSDSKTLFQIMNAKLDTVPVGAIMMWSGNPSAIPAGYLLCNGSSGTPDLRGRFVIGHDPRTVDPGNGIWDANYNTVGYKGGEKKHTLSVSELPQHSHALGFDTVDGGEYPTIIMPGASEGSSDFEPGLMSDTGTVSTTPNNQPHENRPPFYVVAYIIKAAVSTGFELGDIMLGELDLGG